MTRQGGRFEHIDSYAYAAVASQRGSPEQRKECGRGVLLRGPLTEKGMQRALLFNSDSLEKTSSIPFRDNVCIFVRRACAHGPSWHRHRMSSSAAEMDFSRFTKQCYTWQYKRRDPWSCRGFASNKASHWLIGLSRFHLWKYAKHCICLFPIRDTLPHWKAVQRLIF